jgi:serine/threonine-protein kinase
MPHPSPNPPHRTVRLRRGGPDPPPDGQDTDFELSASAVLPPAVRLVPHPEPAPAPPAGSLDPDTLDLFQQRLRLCCLVAAAPVGFFFLSALTGFIELFGREVVGWTGAALAGVVLVGLLATAAVIPRRHTLTETALRVTEIGVFGTVGLFFAYWQFELLTADVVRVGAELVGPPDPRPLQYYALAAALIVHFNWFALLVLHGVLVPNTPGRGAGVAAGVVLVAVLMDAVGVAVHEPIRRQALVLFTVCGTMLVAGAGLSVFGTAKTAALRREVQHARRAVRELGQYRLRRKLGQGGMGEVYLAEHRLLKRPCAVKRIHPKYLHSPEQVRRFEREVQATARLRHPNTVEVYDYGRADDGTFYYVMEYLPGLSLEEIVGRYGPLPPERAVHLLRQVCGALREAHRSGLVHRDIKPSNILVHRDGNPSDQAKLVDFGLVQSLDPEPADGNGKITRDGLIVGTPEYMSPEQAQGLALDGRSDLFSLGSVAYFQLTGREAFHRENPVKTLLAVVNEEPKPLAEVDPRVPADVAAVVARCLAKSPDARYARAGELEQALAGCRCAGRWTERAAADWWDARPDVGTGTGTDLNSLPLQEPAG